MGFFMLRGVRHTDANGSDAESDSSRSTLAGGHRTLGAKRTETAEKFLLLDILMAS